MDRFTTIVRVIAGLALCGWVGAVGAALVTINGVSLVRGVDYSPLAPTTTCTARTVSVGGPIPGTIISNGGTDGFDCGLNVPFALINPGANINVPGAGTTIKLGEALLNERAIITLGLFPKGDGTSLVNLGMTVSFAVNGTTLTFVGTATNYVGGPAASGDPTAIAACDNPNQTTFPQCINDTALDFRVAFAGTQTVTVGAETLSFTLDPLEFFNNTSVVNITARAISNATSTVPEPHPLALLAIVMLTLAVSQQRRHRR